MSKDNFYNWVAECCKEMDKPVEFGMYLLPDLDPSWYWCYDDGFSPKEAVERYRAVMKVREQEKEND